MAFLLLQKKIENIKEDQEKKIDFLRIYFFGKNRKSIQTAAMVVMKGLKTP